MSMQLFTELFKHLDAATFGAGVVFGVALSIAAIVVINYILRFWKPILILSAVVTALSLLLLAI